MSNGLIAPDDVPLLASESKYSMTKLPPKSVESKNQLAAPVTPPAAATAVVEEAGEDVPLKIKTFLKFRYQGVPTGQEVLSHAPLVSALQDLNLDPNAPLHIRKIWLNSHSIVSKSPLGAQLANVNGKDLELERHSGDHFKWATHTVHPSATGASVDYSHLNGGSGMLLHQSELDQHDKVNSRISLNDMWADVKTHPDYMEDGEPTHYVISANFAGYADPENVTQEQKVASMTSVAQLVYTNAKPQINNHPAIQQHLPGVQLQSYSTQEAANNLFSEVDVRHDNSGKQKHRFNVLVKADEFNRVMSLYGKQLEQTPKATKAADHTVSIFRPGQTDPAIEPKSTNTIGNIAGEGGVSLSDIERSKTTWSTMHLVLTYEIDHPGTAAAGK